MVNWSEVFAKVMLRLRCRTPPNASVRRRHGMNRSMYLYWSPARKVVEILAG